MSSKTTSGRSGFLKQGSILAAASILVRIIGMLYRIPMANTIGDEGNGIYSAAFEIYNILLIISSYGMPMAVSKMVSAQLTYDRHKQAYWIFRCAMVFSVISGGLCSLLVFFGADWLEQHFFHSYYGVAIPLRVLAPTIFIVAVMGTIRGLFQGLKTMMPTALSQIIEQIVNAFVSVFMAWYLMSSHRDSTKVAAWGAAGGTLGTCLGAVSALLLLLFICAMYAPVVDRKNRHDHYGIQMSVSQTYKLIFATVIPIILSQTVYQLSGIVDVTMINVILSKKGIAGSLISTWQGIYSTKYRLLVSVPIAVSTAIASSMIPSLVSSYVNRDRKQIHQKVNLAIKFNMIIAFPSAVGLAVVARPIIQVLFPSADSQMGSRMMILGSTCIIFYALSTVTSGVLQSIDRMSLPVWHSLISLIVHIVLVAVLMTVTNMGVYALVVGNVTYPMLVCYLNGRSVSRALKFKQEIRQTFAIPLVASLVMGGLTYGTFTLLHSLLHSNIIALLPALLVAVGSYFTLVLRMGSLSRQELYEFPMGRRMSILADKLHLLKD